MTPTTRPDRRRGAPWRRLASARAALAAAILVLGLAGAGCVELEQTIQVRPDGSGLVLSDLIFSEKMIAEMTSAGEDWETMKKDALPRMEESGPGAAAALGEGVEFVSVEEIAGADRPTFRFTFRFDDVARVRPNPMAPLASEMPGADAGVDEQIRLSLERSGGSSVLSVKLFDEEELQQLAEDVAEQPADDDAASEMASQMEKGMMEMFKEMFDGFALRLSVETLGRIVETNASFVEGSRVTLFDLDFGKLLDDPEALARIGGDGQEQPSLLDLRAAFAEVEGVRIDLQSMVRIVFAE
ncbi:MAG TPA: hypothetical protein VMV46_08620 [Thermoanaerobaculia bacterium]|nr:hypothetical protein [Thermoanaerobaculia bacterium]